MEKLITIYHGSEKIVDSPTFGKGKEHKDFGLGFYCTESDDLAKEWAVSSLRNGFSNKYTLDAEYLNVLNLNSPDYTILNWIAVLMEHRVFSLKTPVARRAKRYLIDNFSVNVNALDAISKLLPYQVSAFCDAFTHLNLIRRQNVRNTGLRLLL